VCYIDEKLKDRFDPKRLRLYEDADDAMQDKLMTNFGIQIDDWTKEGFVVEDAFPGESSS
jgi:hypothetical protein